MYDLKALLRIINNRTGTHDLILINYENEKLNAQEYGIIKFLIIKMLLYIYADNYFPCGIHK